jgi:hypothetical protein
MIIGQKLYAAQKDSIPLPRAAKCQNCYEAWLKEKPRKKYLYRARIAGLVAILSLLVFLIGTAFSNKNVAGEVIAIVSLSIVIISGIFFWVFIDEYNYGRDEGTSDIAKLWSQNRKKFERVCLADFLSRSMTRIALSTTKPLYREGFDFESEFDSLAMKIMYFIVSAEFSKNNPAGTELKVSRPRSDEQPGYESFEVTCEMATEAYKRMKVLEELVLLFQISNNPKSWRASLHKKSCTQVNDASFRNIPFVLDPLVLDL